MSVDPWPAQVTWAGDLGLSFPILTDQPTPIASRLYDVFDQGTRRARRVTYVIDKRGIIRGKVEDQTDVSTHPHEALRIVREIEMKSRA